MIKFILPVILFCLGKSLYSEQWIELGNTTFGNINYVEHSTDYDFIYTSNKSNLFFSKIYIYHKNGGLDSISLPSFTLRGFFVKGFSAQNEPDKSLDRIFSYGIDQFGSTYFYIYNIYNKTIYSENINSGGILIGRYKNKNYTYNIFNKSVNWHRSKNIYNVNFGETAPIVETVTDIEGFEDNTYFVDTGSNQLLATDSIDVKIINEYPEINELRKLKIYKDSIILGSREGRLVIQSLINDGYRIIDLGNSNFSINDIIVVNDILFIGANSRSITEATLYRYDLTTDSIL